MLRVFVLFALCTSVYCVDHKVFKNCSRVAFCSNFRNQTLDSQAQFAADLLNYKIVNKTAYVPLINGKNESLQLQILLLENDSARLKIVELNHTRYELQEPLDGEPKSIAINSEKVTDSSLMLANKLSSFTVTVEKGPPFKVVFRYDDDSRVVLNGNRLVMQNTEDSQVFSFGIDFTGANKLYGLYHHADQLSLGETADFSTDPFRLKNLDTDNYEAYSPMALYGAVPAIYGHSANHTSGIYLNNAAEQWVDIHYDNSESPTGSAYFMVESGMLDLFVLMGPTPKEVVRQFTRLTGVAHLPQLWTLGYHQSRWSYMTQEDVKDVVAKMNKNQFPMDAIWLDIDYTDGKRYFTWNPVNFSDPIEMQKNISSSHKKLVAISDPHIKVDENYVVYTGAKDFFGKWSNGSNFEGNSWPGLSSYIDFLNPEARDYYASWYSYDKFNGTTETLAGFWNDMNEPSVYDESVENTLPFQTIHYGNVTHRDVHNIYGFMQTKATHQGLMERDNGTKRPFVLTRSHFAGSQRYSSAWTGDNTASWDHLAVSYAECLISNILGMVFCGADIGGFAGNPDTQLLQRWYQAGVWLPFYRGHADKMTERREPYLFPEDVQEVIRNAIKLRYKHLPVWYTLFYEHTRYGDPVVRPLFYQYPDVLVGETHLLVGTDILVRPVVEPNVTEVDVNFPGDKEIWYRIDDESWSVHYGGTVEKITVGIKDSPAYYRGGSIIIRKERERLSSTEMLDDPYTLYINLDSNKLAEGRFYVDDYTSFEYLNNATYLYWKLTYVAELRAVRFDLIDGNSEGLAPSVQQIIVHEPTDKGVKGTVYTSTVDGTSLSGIDFAKHMREQSSHSLIFPL